MRTYVKTILGKHLRPQFIWKESGTTYKVVEIDFVKEQVGFDTNAGYRVVHFDDVIFLDRETE